MKLIVNFSARMDGNCGRIADFIAEAGDRIVHYQALNASGCTNCSYECFDGACIHRSDGIYNLYASMGSYEQVVLIVPMYGGNPCAAYFAFSERGQDYFRIEADYEAVVSRMYIIGVYGSAAESPDFIPCLEKWFACTPYPNRVLGLERHVYGQKMADCLLDSPEVCEKIKSFVQSRTGG